MEVDGAVAVLVHGPEDLVDLLFVDVVAQASQEELKGATGDVAGVVAVVHLEDFLEFLDLFGLVGGKGGGVLLGHERRTAL